MTTTTRMPRPNRSSLFKGNHPDCDTRRCCVLLDPGRLSPRRNAHILYAIARGKPSYRLGYETSAGRRMSRCFTFIVPFFIALTCRTPRRRNAGGDPRQPPASPSSELGSLFVARFEAPVEPRLTSRRHPGSLAACRRSNRRAGPCLVPCLRRRDAGRGSRRGAGFSCVSRRSVFLGPPAAPAARCQTITKTLAEAART